MSVEFINFDLSDKDLNGLFNFNYNIDMLKEAITALIKNQKFQNQKIFDLEFKIENNFSGNGNFSNSTNIHHQERINKIKEFEEYKKNNGSLSLEVKLFNLEKI